ncbi:Na/Pi cotransporter family protein [Reichenbachiella carrageenanivorans]|uniref:Na/Pi cotransporter family protein n=1 Tax=Reichenbachiella carrageenanivorans TaxID=2979869 RepID=A0ABY6CX30_9BACT|nr:Na/Pi cotransporter family protein [Reichenbachiella carrageenanivorans]UXX78479.1 Na/Pi cotransporter family protein [Reichenbachiella carrageenanivorans]
MEYGIFDILQLIGALGFFIYGMKVMSESIQKAAGDSLRSVMSIITSNRVSGVFTGFLTTAIIQSSSATTVMVVSFVNAGLLKLRQAIGVIMGANIGTTITGVLILVFGFSKFSISHYTLPIIAVGFPMLFAKKVEWKYWGEFLIGFSLLFMGLDALKHAVPDLKQNPEILEWIADINNLGFISVIISVLIGTILTVVVQSSSAAMTVTLIMCHNGWIPFDMAAGIVLGENIGTTITANLAALVGNVHAKRAALSHFMFNVFGVVWMLLVFNLYIGTIDSIMVSFDLGSPLNDTASINWGLICFHTSFNIVNTLIMIWFVPQIEQIVTKLVTSKDEEDEEFHLEFIGTQLMRTAELSLMEARKEVVNFSKQVVKMSRFVQELVTSDDNKRIEALTEKISKYEDRTDELEMEIDDYLVKVSEGRLSTAASEEIRAIMSITSDLERSADIFMRMSREINRKNKHNLTFTSDQILNIQKIFGLVDAALAEMHKNLKSDYSEVLLEGARKSEEAINKMKKELSKKHWKSVEENHYDVQTGIVYRDIIFGCERIGDHVINVTESIVGIEEHVSVHHHH